MPARRHWISSATPVAAEPRRRAGAKIAATRWNYEAGRGLVVAVAVAVAGVG